MRFSISCLTLFIACNYCVVKREPPFVVGNHKLPYDARRTDWSSPTPQLGSRVAAGQGLFEEFIGKRLTKHVPDSTPSEERPDRPASVTQPGRVHPLEDQYKR